MAAVVSGSSPGEDVLVEMGHEVGVIRACIDQFIGGIRPGEEAQVQQARVVQRVQDSLERLAALGQDAHRVLPPSLNEVRHRQTPRIVLHLPAGPCALRPREANGLLNPRQHLVGEKDRPVAVGSEPAAAAQLYEAFGTGLDVSPFDSPPAHLPCTEFPPPAVIHNRAACGHANSKPRRCAGFDP